MVHLIRGGNCVGYANSPKRGRSQTVGASTEQHCGSTYAKTPTVRGMSAKPLKLSLLAVLASSKAKFNQRSGQPALPMKIRTYTMPPHYHIWQVAITSHYKPINRW